MSERPAGVAVVSGAGAGIGREVALLLASRGYRLGLLGRHPQPLIETLAAAGGQGLTLPCDVREGEAVAAAATTLRTQLGPPELLVPAAGAAVIADLTQTPVESFAAVVETNLGGTFNLLRAFLPDLQRAPRAWIFPILSVAATRGFPGWSAYCASKWGVRGLLAALRLELQGSEVRITAIYPGATDTELWAELPGDWDRQSMIPAAEVARAVGWALDCDPRAALEEIHLGPARGSL